MDFKHQQKRVTIKANGIKKKKDLNVIEGNPNYKTKKNKILTDLDAGEIKVLRINNLTL